MVGTLLVGTLATSALAGDQHAVSNRWAGAAIGAGAVVAGCLLLNAFSAPFAVVAPPVVYAPPPPPVVYAPPPVVYTPPPVAYAPPPVVYMRTPGVYGPPPAYYGPPVIVQRGWGPPGHWRHHRHWDQGEHGIPPMVEEWHRKMHEPQAPAGSTKNT